MKIELLKAGSAACYALVVWGAFVRPRWPWDCLGRRRTVTLKRARRPWE